MKVCHLFLFGHIIMWKMLPNSPKKKVLKGKREQFSNSSWGFCGILNQIIHVSLNLNILVFWLWDLAFKSKY